MNVIIISGSDSDLEHMIEIKNALDDYHFDSTFRICSAHKDPVRLLEIIGEQEEVDGTVWVSVAGLTDALSGVISFHSRHPVISCPPDPTNYSCLGNPRYSSNATIFNPTNVAKFIAQMFSSDPHIREQLGRRTKAIKSVQARKDQSYREE